MRAIAAVSRAFNGFDYIVRRGLLRGMRRRGGLAWMFIRRMKRRGAVIRGSRFRGKVIYDIGPFHGLFTLHFARTARAVIAFEPLPAHCRIIERNVELNGLRGKVRVLPYDAESRMPRRLSS